MSEHSQTPSKSPRTKSNPLLGLVGVLVLVAVLGMPMQAAAFFAPGHGPAAGAPVSLSPAASTPTQGLHIAPSVLSSPLGIRDPQLFQAFLHPLNVGSPASHLQLLGQLLPQTAAPRNAPEVPAYSGQVNNYVGSSDCQGWGTIQGPNGQYIPTIAGSSIAQVGGSNQTLVAGGGSLLNIFNTTGGVLCTNGFISNATLLYGYSNVFLSTTGGASWTNFSVPSNTTHWLNPTDPAFSSMSTGNDVVAAAPDGLALELTGYAPACLSIPLAITCGSTLGQSAPWGYGVTRSTDGGHTWSEVAQVSSDIAFSLVTFPSSCNISPNPDLLANDIPEHPWIATNGTYAVATWDVLHVIWDPANCSLAGYQATVQASYSWDMGATWSAPVNASGPVSQSATVQFGPAPNYPIYEVFSDVSSTNASTSGQIQFQWTRSTNGGQTWTPLGTSQQIGSHNVNPTCYGCSVAPDAIDTSQTPSFVVDNWTASPHSGNLYIAWQDNTTGSSTGQVSIAFERSTNGGTTWFPVHYLTTASASVHYVEPAITVTPDGNVWVTYYGFGTGTGFYNLYGVVSTDGGATWSAQFLVSSAASTPATTLQDIGFYMGGAGTSAGFVPIWDDCRTAACSSGNNVQLYTANVNVLNITTNASKPVTAQVTVFGYATSATLPMNVGVDNGATVQVSVPAELPLNATYVLSFSGWTGLTSSLNYKTSFTYLGSGALVATYTPVEAAFISGTLSPNGPGASVTVDNVAAALTAFNSTAYQYTVSVPSGQAYYVNASETKYTGQNRLVPVQPGQTTWVNFTLSRQTGFITGTITPSDAFLVLNTTTNETGLINPANGQFSITLPWGWYWLNASKPGFTSSTCQGHEVQVNPGVATTCNFNLVGGWIYGTVVPAKNGLVITVDGAVVASPVGVFNVSVSGGFHTLAATQPGYNLSVINSIAVIPGHATLVNVTLTNHGYISGIISPVAALKNLLLTVTNGSTGGPQTYSPTTGAFNVSVLGGLTYTVTVSSSGYNTSVTHVAVTAGNTSLDNIVLGVASCTGSNCNGNGNGNGNGNNNSNNGTPGQSGVPLIDVLGIVIVVVVIAVVAVALLMRRRGGGGASESMPPPPDETYQSSNPSELPKLQSDGSMGEGNPPQ